MPGGKWRVVNHLLRRVGSRVMDTVGGCWLNGSADAVRRARVAGFGGRRGQPKRVRTTRTHGCNAGSFAAPATAAGCGECPDRLNMERCGDWW